MASLTLIKRFSDLPQELQLCAHRVDKRITDARMVGLDPGQLVAIVNLIIKIIQWFASRNKPVSKVTLGPLQRASLWWLAYRSGVKCTSTQDLLNAVVEEADGDVVTAYNRSSLSYGEVVVKEG